MVGIGIAGCAPCNCEPADCCFPSDVVSFTLVSDSACPLNDEVVTITRTTYTDSGESTTYEPNGNAIWVGTYDTSAICADTDEIKVIMYCATISGVENWVAELYCDGTRQATIATTEFTCTDGELTAVLFISPDLGALCCGCAGLPCGAGGSVGTVTLPAECTPVTVDCCENAIPQTLYATISGGAFSGSVTLEWDGTGWEGQNTTCGATFGFRLDCLPIINGDSCLSMQVGPPSGISPACTVSPAVPTETCSCDPLELTYTGTATQVGSGSCCETTITIVITE